MYNEFVKMYCDTYGLDIEYSDGRYHITEGGERIGHFRHEEKIVFFKNGNVLKKGDLLHSILEKTSLH